MDQRFPRERRLTTAGEFTRVFKEGRRHASGPFLLRVAPNPLGHARLGLAVAKRVLPRAVDRNRAKRQIREAFRLHAGQLPALDIVVSLRAPRGRWKDDGQRLVEQFRRLSRLQRQMQPVE